MRVKARNRLLDTSQVRGVPFTDEAMEQLRQQVIGVGVYSDYRGSNVYVPREYSADELKQAQTYGQDHIGYVRDVQDSSLIIDLDADEVPFDLDSETLVAKIDLLAEPLVLEDGSIIEQGIVRVLGVYLVEEHCEADHV